VGLLSLAELPYTLKLFWAPLLDRWPIPWPDRRRGWLLLLQLALVVAIAAMALLNPHADPAHLTLVGLSAIALAVLSASQDVMVDAYRTDLMPEAERGAGAAAGALGYRAAMLAVGAVAVIAAGYFAIKGIPPVEKGAEGTVGAAKRYQSEQIAKGDVVVQNLEVPVAGQLSAAEYDVFVRDTVNFLDYVGEPAKLHRTSIGIWVILFLLVLAGFMYAVKRQVWADKH